MSLPPICRSISVSWDQAAAFRRFTADFGTWWPSGSHSIGGPLVRRIVFEPKVGGCIYEEHLDGRRFQWGEIRLWEPPQRVEFTWHPAREPETAQDVAVAFVPEGSGTRVEAHCERLGTLGQACRACAPRLRRRLGVHSQRLGRPPYGKDGAARRHRGDPRFRAEATRRRAGGDRARPRRVAARLRFTSSRTPSAVLDRHRRASRRRARCRLRNARYRP